MLLVVIYFVCIVVGVISLIALCNFISDREIKAAIICGIILVITGFIAIFGLTHRVEESEKITNTYELIALQDTQTEEFSCTKTIFTMRIDKKDTPVYRFYYQNKRGEINFEEKGVYDISIVYTDATPYYEITKTQTKIEDSFFGIKSSYYLKDTTYSYKLYLPEGSIASDIVIDMQ